LSTEILKRFNFHGHMTTSANGFATKRRAFLAANMLAAIRSVRRITNSQGSEP
jgi:hypothetical protein